MVTATKTRDKEQEALTEDTIAEPQVSAPRQTEKMTDEDQFVANIVATQESFPMDTGIIADEIFRKAGKAIELPPECMRDNHPKWRFHLAAKRGFPQGVDQKMRLGYRACNRDCPEPGFWTKSTLVRNLKTHGALEIENLILMARPREIDVSLREKRLEQQGGNADQARERIGAQNTDFSSGTAKVWINDQGAAGTNDPLIKQIAEMDQG